MMNNYQSSPLSTEGFFDVYFYKWWHPHKNGASGEYVKEDKRWRNASQFFRKVKDNQIEKFIEQFQNGETEKLNDFIEKYKPFIATKYYLYY
jgi:hypothetical protein